MRGIVLLFLWHPGDPKPDRWFGPDKVEHFAMSFFVQSASYSALRAGTSHRVALAGASVATAAVGIGKEWHDRGTTDFSVKDLMWDGAGALAASVLMAQTDRR